MSQKDYDFPDDRRYTRSDEWIQGVDANARIGVTDYAQSELSDVVFVELPEVGSVVEAEQAFGIVESVKAVSALLAPIAGEIVEINPSLEDNPEWVNEDPYGRGWIAAIAPRDAADLDTLMDADEYRLYVEERDG